MDFIQYNIRGLENNRNDIDTLDHLYKPSLFCLQESHIKNNNAPTFSKYQLIHNKNDKATQGVAFLIRNGVKFSEIALNTNYQAIAISLNVPFKVNICNIYIHPNLKIVDSEFQSLIDQIPEPRVFLGDFNAHSFLWNSDRSNQRGQAIENATLNNNLMCINEDQITYFHPSSGKATKIDLTLCNISIAPKFTWRALEQIQSDHVPILISTKNSHSRTIHNNTINYKNIDWMEFKDTLKSTQLIVSPEIDVRIHSITNLIIEALKSSDKNVTKNLKKCIPWWTPTLSYLRKEKIT